jgi:hypothetical protein
VNRIYREAEDLVRNHVRKEWDEETRWLVAQARTDLWFGPGSRDEGGDDHKPYPGWVVASEQIRELIGELPGDLWVDMQAEQVVDSEPVAWEDPETGEVFEPCLEDYAHFDRRAIARAVLGSDLVGNL